MNLTDLTEVLRDHAEFDDTAQNARMAGVRARVRATRRRIALSGVVCVVLALVGAVYLTVPRPVEPADPARSFPQYANGARLVVQAWGDLPANSVTVEYTPTSDNFVLINRCVTESADQDLVTTTTINGHETRISGCDGGESGEIGDLTRFGGAVGKPLVITMTVGYGPVVGELPDYATDIRPPEDTAIGEFGVGVAELVPVDEYPFPDRPETLEDVDDLIAPDNPGDIRVRADRNDPDAPQTLSVTWPGSCNLNVAINTPGRLEVLVDDQAVYDVEAWNYDGLSGFATVGEDAGLHIPPGQSVTITVVPERTTGDWIVQFSYCL